MFKKMRIMPMFVLPFIMQSCCSLFCPAPKPFQWDTENLTSRIKGAETCLAKSGEVDKLQKLIKKGARVATLCRNLHRHYIGNECCGSQGELWAVEEGYCRDGEETSGPRCQNAKNWFVGYCSNKISKKVVRKIPKCNYMLAP